MIFAYSDSSDSDKFEAKKSDKSRRQIRVQWWGVSCERANLIIAWLEIAELGACLSSNLLKWRANQSVNSGWAHEPRPASGRIEAGFGGGEQNRDCQFHLRDTSRVLP
jgi:hypothetical protein